MVSKHGVTLYSYALQQIKESTSFRIMVLTDMEEGTQSKIQQETLPVFLRLCEKHHLYAGYHWENIKYPNLGIRGYYFPRIWKHAVLSKISETLCPKLERDYSTLGVKMIVNSGLGVYTVFFDHANHNTKTTQQSILDAVTSYIKPRDPHHLITDFNEILSFDLMETLESFDGNLYQYYK